MTDLDQKKYRAALILAGISFSCLVILGIFRPQLPEALRSHWVSAITLSAIVAAASLLLDSRRTSKPDPYPRALAALFVIVLAAMYMQPQRVASDGIFYFAPLRSVVVEGNLDFENEYRVLGATEGYFHRTDTGRLPNNFSIGPSLLWAPFYVAVHLLGHVGFFRPTGFGYPYFTTVATATVLIGFLGVVWFYRLAARYFDPPIAFVATVVLWLGSFHVWYMVFEPSMSHALAMAMVAGYLLLCQRGPKDWLAFALVGAVAGLVVLVRWQNIVFLPVGWVLIWRQRGRPKWQELAVSGAAALIVFFPQMIYWKLLYGEFLLVPQGGNYMQWGSPQIEAVLFSSRHGLFSWSPILWIGAIGFFAFIRKERIFGMAYLVAFLVALYINASVSDWWAGASFGARRFDGALPAFGLGLAMAVGWGLAWIKRHPLATVLIILSPFLIWNVMLMGTRALGSVPYDGAVSFKSVGAEGLEMIYRYTGYPFSWPGAAVERYRSGVPLAVYDLAGARHLYNNVDIRMGDNDALFLGPGWSLPLRRRERTYRSAEASSACLYVALREPAPYRLDILGTSEGEIQMHWNGALVDARFLDVNGGIPIEIRHELVRSGVNQICFSSPERRHFEVSRVKLQRPGRH
jgi:hypothetical protein